MKFLFIFILAILGSLGLTAQYSDPNIAIPDSGYGADGNHTIALITIPNPAFSGQNIQIFHPGDISTPVPTIFYSHAFGGNNSNNIAGLTSFVAKKGYAFVFVPYQTVGVSIPERYDNLLNGFQLAARMYPNVIDTTRAGFMGHSFGGGATFANAHYCTTVLNWGQNGKFLYSLAPWYGYNLSEGDLTSFIANTNVLIEVFENDSTNDHRMAIDFFDHINVPNEFKDFITLKSDTLIGYVHMADHGVPNTVAHFDALDYYGIYRLLDALCDYTFNGNVAGKAVALGNGGAAQITMPAGMKPLEESDNPQVQYPQSQYEYPCSSSQNPRSSYCPEIPTGLNATTESDKLPVVYPNPFTSRIYYSNQDPGIWFSLYSVDGTLLYNGNQINKLDLSQLPSGIYFLKAENRTIGFFHTTRLCKL